MNLDNNNSSLSSITINYRLSKPEALIDFSKFNSILSVLTLDSIGDSFHFNNKFPFSKLPSTLKSFILANSNGLPYLNSDDVNNLLIDYSVFNGIVSVELISNNFNGTLPSKYNGENISLLNLSNNKLKGTIDSSYCTVLLYVLNNQLTGSLPSCYSCYIGVGTTGLMNRFLGNPNLNLTIPSSPCTTIIPQIKIENNNTVIYGNDLGFGLNYLTISGSGSIPTNWKIGTISKSYYLENFIIPTNFTVSFINSPSILYTLSTIENPPFISNFQFITYSSDYKVIIFQGSFFTYNSSDISVEFGTGPYRKCSIISSTFYEIQCSFTNFAALRSNTSSTTNLSTVIKIISNTNLKIQFPIEIGNLGNVNFTSPPVSLCNYGQQQQQQANNCNYFNGQGECGSSGTCVCNIGWIGSYCQQQTHIITSVIPSNQYGGLVIINGEFGVNHVGIFVTIGNGTINDPEKGCQIQSVSQNQITCFSQSGIGKTKLTLGQNNYNSTIDYQFNAICSSDCNSLVGSNTNYCNNLTGLCSCDLSKFQGSDCKTPFIPCQDDCNSALNQGTCNNVTGVCACTNNKWTVTSYCSVANHFCSSITPAPSGIGGPITLYGWFGNKHEDLQISIGGLECISIVPLSDDQINCTIPSNTGIQTVNITQNNLTWIGINKFQYYQVIKSCPNKCSNQGTCNQTNGQCNCNNGYSGFDCSAVIKSSSSTTSSTTTSPSSSTEESSSSPSLPVTQSEIDIQTGTLSLNNEETKYKLYIKSLIEVDINDKPVKTYDLQDKWINTDSNDLTGTYLFKQTLSANNNGGYLISTIQEIKQTKEMNFAGVDFKLESGSIKVSIEINNYTYSSNLNTLQLLFISSVNVDNEISNNDNNNCNEGDTQVQNINNDSDLNYIKIEKNGKILMGRFVNSVISDGRPTLITSTNLGGEEGNNNDSIIVALNLPHCINQCQIDPDFAVLVSPSYKSYCDTDSNNDRKNWLLPVVIVVPIVCVSIIVAALITLSKKSIFFKIKIQSIKLKTKK